MADLFKIRREGMRWNIINILNKARPYSTNEAFLYDVMRVIYPDTSPMELRRELDYLGDRDLVDIRKEPSGTWFSDLTRYGVDLAEYTLPCEPGIARPEKFWADS